MPDKIHKFSLLLLIVISSSITNAQGYAISIRTIDRVPCLEVDNKFEKLDIDWLEKNGEQRNMGDNFNYQYQLESDIGLLNISGSKIYGYNRLEYFNNSLFKIVKLYYPNGGIKEKGWMFNDSETKKGTWYEFDNHGKLTKTTDYDKLTEYKFEDAIRFCELENIPLLKGYIQPSTGLHTNISRYYDEKTASYQWYIEWLKNFYLMEKIILDGKTGRVLHREEIEVINN
ncbi:MAG: hypothetical protein RL662_1855 [Bacteroidota bacterium]|jgi:hypothetical protein